MSANKGQQGRYWAHEAENPLPYQDREEGCGLYWIRTSDLVDVNDAL